MDFQCGYLIDTNILLRLSRHSDPQYKLIRTVIDNLNARGFELYFCLQNIAEFWNACTRPVTQNGFGLTILETNLRVKQIERVMTYLPDNQEVYSIWRDLVTAHQVRGVQVHDARLAAIMMTYGLTHILTLNQPDFMRYSNLRAVHPAHLQNPTQA